MCRESLFGLAAFGIIVALPALAGPEIPAAAIDERARLLGEKKVRYLLRQIDLTEEQASHAQGLIDSILAERAHPTPPDLDEVRQIWAELEKAKQAGDRQRVNALTKQMQQLGQNAAGDSEFFTNMESLLTEDQTAKLARARARLERNPSGALRPVDLLRTARGFELTEQQQGQLLDAFLATRRQLGPILKPSKELKLRMINFFADEIRVLLTSDQLAKFDYRTRALRPDLIDCGLRVRLPQTPPDEPPAGGQTKPSGE